MVFRTPEETTHLAGEHSPVAEPQRAALISARITESPTFRSLSSETQQLLANLMRRDPRILLDLAREADRAGTNAREFETFLRTQAALSSQQLQAAVALLRPELAEGARITGLSSAQVTGDVQQIRDAAGRCSEPEQQAGTEIGTRQRAAQEYLRQAGVVGMRGQEILNDALFNQFILHGSLDTLRSVLETHGIEFDQARFTQIIHQEERTVREQSTQAGISSSIIDRAFQHLEDAFTALLSVDLSTRSSESTISAMTMAELIERIIAIIQAFGNLEEMGLDDITPGRSRRRTPDGRTEGQEESQGQMSAEDAREELRALRRRFEDLLGDRIRERDPDMTNREIDIFIDQLMASLESGAIRLLDGSARPDQRTVHRTHDLGQEVPVRTVVEISGMQLAVGNTEIGEQLRRLFG